MVNWYEKLKNMKKKNIWLYVSDYKLDRVLNKIKTMMGIGKIW